ncbi:DNRLRE domain-containing protein, partial [Kineosporia sp. R_H_3]|uniref:CBM96 family carbohydrate-binding protein n=1 Tax=Kineosporia sp. R_H_3 TaxID=1961848 RepID=UPI001E3FEABE
PPPPPPSPGTSLTFTPVADAQTKSTSATTNYGTATSVRLRAGTTASPGDYRTYLRFSVSGIASTVTSAKLRLFVTDASAVGGSVFRTTGAWTETGLTWSTQPATSGAALSTAGRTTVGQWVELDVTSAVTANGTLDLGLTTSSTDSGIFSSREGANPPQLVVSTT